MLVFLQHHYPHKAQAVKRAMPGTSPVGQIMKRYPPLSLVKMSSSVGSFWLKLSAPEQNYSISIWQLDRTHFYQKSEIYQTFIKLPSTVFFLIKPSPMVQPHPYMTVINQDVLSVTQKSSLSFTIQDSKERLVIAKFGLVLKGQTLQLSATRNPAHEEGMEYPT